MDQIFDDRSFNSFQFTLPFALHTLTFESLVALYIIYMLSSNGLLFAPTTYFKCFIIFESEHTGGNEQQTSKKIPTGRKGDTINGPKHWIHKDGALPQ